VSSSITERGIYSGGVLHGRNAAWKRNAIRFARLDELFRRMARLESALEAGEIGAVGAGGASRKQGQSRSPDAS
jgi:hypothetical protein